MLGGAGLARAVWAPAPAGGEAGDGGGESGVRAGADGCGVAPLKLIDEMSEPERIGKTIRVRVGDDFAVSGNDLAEEVVIARLGLRELLLETLDLSPEELRLLDEASR